jgi:hypothetical protein
MLRTYRSDVVNPYPTIGSFATMNTFIACIFEDSYVPGTPPTAPVISIEQGIELYFITTSFHAHADRTDIVQVGVIGEACDARFIGCHVFGGGQDNAYQVAQWSGVQLISGVVQGTTYAVDIVSDQGDILIDGLFLNGVALKSPTTNWYRLTHLKHGFDRHAAVAAADGVADCAVIGETGVRWRHYADGTYGIGDGTGFTFPTGFARNSNGDLRIDLPAASNQLALATGGIRLPEIADPSAPAANNGVLYTRDNGSGKTQLCVRFPTGAVQVLATEP